jgi:hypothetical protein
LLLRHVRRSDVSRRRRHRVGIGTGGGVEIAHHQHRKSGFEPADAITNEGGTFLEAFERLKGGGAITQPEGEKATRAISRMERSVSEVAYVEAAREFEGIIRTALKRAEDRYARLQNQKPAGQNGAPKRLRFNPATGGFE